MAVLFALLALAGFDLNRDIQSVLPTSAEEKWLSIPWRTNLMRARSEAQSLKKPLFLWVMNGHPMGCT